MQFNHAGKQLIVDTINDSTRLTTTERQNKITRDMKHKTLAAEIQRLIVNLHSFHVCNEMNCFLQSDFVCIQVQIRASKKCVDHQRDFE